MTLSKDAYRALEDIVGTEYITSEPVIAESYVQVWGNKLSFGQKHTRPPAAVLLPADTQEVQAVVKACNRHRVPFKALAAGFEFVATALEKEGSIILDLRRMDRILEIDARNMHAIVEPYVSVYKLQMEAARHGLYYGRPGVGYSANVLVLTCCHQEMLNSQVYTSGFGRNVLGVEWVLPDGELLKLGTSVNEGGWYSADGPGFSLRGILRGRSGANGGHGVITRASIKLYPWFGPPEWDMVMEPGEALSQAQLEKVPERYRAYIASFPSMEALMSASGEIAREQISCVLIPGFTETGFNGEGNDEEWAMLQEISPEQVNEARNSATVILNSYSPRELEYRDSCLRAIMEHYGGRFLPELNTPRNQARIFQYQMWSTGVPGLRATGDFMVSIQGSEGSQEMMMKLRPVEAEAAEPFVKSGAIMQSLSGIMYRPQEHFSLGCSCGIGTNFDPWDPVSLKAAREYMNSVYDPNGKFRRFGYTGRGAMIQAENIDHIHQNWGPVYDNCDYWLMQVKKMLDPNNVSDALAYIPPEYSRENSQDR